MTGYSALWNMVMQSLKSGDKNDITQIKSYVEKSIPDGTSLESPQFIQFYNEISYKKPIYIEALGDVEVDILQLVSYWKNLELTKVFIKIYSSLGLTQNIASSELDTYSALDLALYQYNLNTENPTSITLGVISTLFSPSANSLGML